MTSETMVKRNVKTIVPTHTVLEGGGFKVRRPVAMGSLMSPFLLLDEMGPVNYGPREAIGAPAHPHRGFETVTYMLEGAMQHSDSAGNSGDLNPGDVQWMTAGRGIIHSELPHPDFYQAGDSAHDAAVIGDTIGDPFKDTSGPSLNILIKLMSIVAVVLAGTGKLNDTGLL